MTRKRILNLGAGVQSTTLYLMAMEGEIDAIDVAIFADTQEEPAAVSRHLEWLRSLGGPEIVTVTAGRLGDALEKGIDARGNLRKDNGHYISIPAYTKNPQTNQKGILRRQCTADFKVKPIEHYIRRELFGVEPGRPLPKDCHVQQLMGLSYDEPKRVIRVQQRFMAKPKTWSVEFPLWDLEMTRGDCVKYLADRVPHTTPRSACTFCPFKSDDEWRWLKENDAEGWARSIEIDTVCRTGEGLDSHRYLHRSCQPLELVDLRTDIEKGQRVFGFMDECEGYCGN